MWIWVPMAAAAEITLVEARVRGVPDRSVALVACDCIALSWLDGPEEATFLVPRADVRRVVHEREPSGVHVVSVVIGTDDAEPLVVQRAPCPVAVRLVEDYTIGFGLPATGGALGAQCVDVLTPLIAWREPHFERPSGFDYGRVADVAIGGRARGVEALVDGQLRVSIGACFVKDGIPAPGHVSLTARARDGQLDRLELVAPGPDPAVEACVFRRLEAMALGADARGRLTLDVGWTPVAEGP